MQPWSRDPIWARGPTGAGCQALRGTPKREEMEGGDGVLQRERGDALPVDPTSSQTGLMIDPAEWVDCFPDVKKAHPASISSTVLPATRIFLTLSRPRYCIPEVIRGLGDTRHIQCHRILHEFHTENAPPYLLHGISILIALQIRQFLEGIGLPVTSSTPPSVSS
ncbi:hypothetical protein JB92DRAFT_2824310 [Gautieria morchelliformis]|nr:hypothetical protein JB92DRAFT_2824310 [Gautieria morchelliformis]